MDGERRNTILWVTSDNPSAVAPTTSLTRAGYHVRVAHTADETRRIIAQDQDVCLVVLDTQVGAAVTSTALLDERDATPTVAAEIAAAVVERESTPLVFLDSHDGREPLEWVHTVPHHGVVSRHADVAVLRAGIDAALAGGPPVADASSQVSPSHAFADNRLFASHPDLVCVIDQEYRIMESNAQWSRVLGFSASRLRRRRMLDLIHSVDAPRVADAFVRVSVAVPPVFRARCRAADGSYRELSWRMWRDRETIYLSGRPSALVTGSAGTELDQRAHLRRLFEAAPVGIVVCDEHGKVLVVNAAMARILSCESTHAAVRRFPDIGSQLGGGTATTRHLVSLLQRHGTVDRYEMTGRYEPVETPVWFEISATLTGGIIHAFVTDVSDRKRAEAAMREGETRFRLAVESAPEAIFIQTDGRFAYVNAAALRLFGADMEAELLGTPVIDRFDPSFRDSVAKRIRCLNEDRKPVELREEHCLTLDDRVVPAEISAVPFSFGGKHGALAFARDITDRHRAERRRLQVTDEYETVFNGTQDGLVLIEVGDDGSFTYVRSNRTYAATVGTVPEIVRGQTPVNIYGQEVGTRLMERYRRCVNERVSVTFEETQENSEGRRTWTTTLTPVVSGDRVRRIVSSSQEITRFKAAEEQIERLLVQKDLMLTEVHHRIKNNMNTMMSLLSLEAGTMKSREAVTALNDARSRMQSMEVLYDKLYRTASYQEMSLHDYLPALVEEVASLFPGRREITITVDAQPVELGIKQLSSLGIIVTELITNAMKHAFDGRDDGALHVSARNHGDAFSIVVEDNGHGVPEGVDPETSGGFGMSLIRALTVQFDGTIHLQRDGGTRFTLRFPL